MHISYKLLLNNHFYLISLENAPSNITTLSPATQKSDKLELLSLENTFRDTTNFGYIFIFTYGSVVKILTE